MYLKFKNTNRWVLYSFANILSSEQKLAIMNFYSEITNSKIPLEATNIYMTTEIIQK